MIVRGRQRQRSRAAAAAAAAAAVAAAAVTTVAHDIVPYASGYRGLVAALHTLRVNTTVGEVYGMVNVSTPGVAQFMGIAFAEPPLGSLRFLAPRPKSRENETIDATYTRPNCPQYPINKQTQPNVYTYDAIWLQPDGPTSEDCLTLNVYKPCKALAASNSTGPFPVLVWIFGGGFNSGGLEELVFDPYNWIQRTEEHIVVMIKYERIPDHYASQTTEALFSRNRAQTLTWASSTSGCPSSGVRDNIASFGDDPSRIVIWGQISGSASTDFYNYAYPEDPIVAGLIQHSGSVFATGVSVDDEHKNFTFVAERLGCADLTPADEFACMQHNVSAEAIIRFYGDYNMNHSDYQLKWTTITDNVTKWDDYTARAEDGNYTLAPAIVGSNGNEDASLITWPGSHGPNMTEIREKVRTGRTCPVTYLSNLRYTTGSRTFRYWNNASFPNISPRWWEGAYHTSKLPLLLGTFTEHGAGPPTAFEYEVWEQWQDFYLAFLKDSSGQGLVDMGWPAWSPNGAEAVMVFGEGGGR
ncbi:hypothetical protein INS49_015846 [Diaporthe citri]|uniref:uncharacterized protein n=1 Tax=Diaporthe citri TaxID=83186 RepID=UPI001C7E2580|nr:uncharacterized protein INS49_015846 [Diaporthe citri]KAG6356458.1 hypothetical protein INS49_015846 [Diaporthe citri]